MTQIESEFLLILNEPWGGIFHSRPIFNPLEQMNITILRVCGAVAV